MEITIENFYIVKMNKREFEWLKALLQNPFPNMTPEDQVKQEKMFNVFYHASGVNR